VLDQVIDAGVLPRRLVLRSAVTAGELTALDLGEAFRDRYGAPYVVLHRSDLLNVLAGACREADVALEVRKDVQSVNDSADGVLLSCMDGTKYEGVAVIAADGLHSVIRQMFSDDAPVGSGFVAFRGTAAIEEVTARAALDEVVAWIGPDLHFVQYPLRGGAIYNQVAVFRSRSGEDGPDELDEAFSGCCPQVREATGFLWRDRWWPMYDREPMGAWAHGRVALLGDAAHPMLQYLAQGACQAIEDADVLARTLAARPGARAQDGVVERVAEALGEYQRLRAPHAARVQRAARTWGDIWHVDGVGALLRDELFRRRSADNYDDTDWLYQSGRTCF
jgi:salicylate hydroxylase